MKRFFSVFSERKVYFTLGLLILISVLLLGIFSQFFSEKKKETWKSELIEIENTFSETTLKAFQSKVIFLTNSAKEFKQLVSPSFRHSELSYKDILKLFADYQSDDIAIQLFNEKFEIISWKNSYPITGSKLKSVSISFGQAFFTESPLSVYLVIVDTIKTGRQNFYLVTSTIIEDRTASEPIKDSKSFTAELENEFLTSVEITYHPFKPLNNDGRYLSFELRNLADEKIGTISIKKPSLRNELISFNNRISTAQAILVIFATILLGISVSADFNKFRFRSLRFAAFTVLLIALRWLFLKLDFPSSVLEGKLTDPTLFSSQFGWGIVKSPVEFLITNSFFFLAVIYGFRLAWDYFFFTERKPLKLPVFFITTILFSFIVLLTLRGLSASIKSVIFDSSLRYFNQPDIIPTMPHLIMNLGTLLLGIGVILIISCFLLIILAHLKSLSILILRYYLIGMVVIIILGSILFVHLQKQPLLSVPFYAIISTLIFLIAFFQVFAKPKLMSVFLIYGFTSSIITISLLNHFNTLLERESLKTTAIEITRPNTELLNFLTTQALLTGSNEKTLLESFYKINTDFNELAYYLWTKSSLKGENIYSSITILDRKRTILGTFVSGDLQNYPVGKQVNVVNPVNLTTEEISPKDSPHIKILRGSVPISENNITLGYLMVEVKFEPKLLVDSKIPELFRQQNFQINGLLSPEDINIFGYHNNTLVYAFGDFHPGREHNEMLLAENFPPENEIWTNFTFNNEAFVVYALKTKQSDSEYVVAVALKEKKLEWSFFNFFKLFIVHSILLVICYLISLIYEFLKTGTFRYSFRTQLLFALLFVSLFPLLAIALYNRQNTNEKSEIAIKNFLVAESNIILRQINNYNTLPKQNLISVLEKTASSLDINFSAFEDGKNIFTTEYALYTSAIFPNYIHSSAILHLSYLGYKDHFTSEIIRGRKSYLYFRVFSFGGKNYILQVNDISNKIVSPFTPVDVDVFLFGIYSFAVLLVIAISTLLANKIAYPIKLLTTATKSVAHGDYSIKLENSERGELKELFQGFNTMTEELVKNQAELASLEREAAWKDFAKQVAHEIKNPLTPMKLTLQHLVAAYKDKTPNFDSIFQRVTGTILHQIETLNHIASEFSRFARMPAFKQENFDIVASLHETAELFRQEKVTILIEQEVTNAIVSGDASQFRRILINFVRNSIQAHADTIKFRITANEQTIELFIDDNGDGIPDEYQDKIFDANFTTKAGGMGIGLKLAKRYLEMTNSSIRLIKKDTKGTCFLITIIKPVSDVKQ